MHLPPVIGHRGAAGLAPENTLAGFRAAQRAGVAWVEFDVRLSRDRQCVVIHDAGLERTTGRRAPVSRTDLADMRGYDAGSRFSPEFAGEGVPGLDDTLKLLATLGLGANLELKPCGRRNPALVAALMETLSRRGRGAPPVLVSSFSPALLRAVRRCDARLPLGLLLKRRRRPGWRRIARALGCLSIHCADQGLSADAVRLIRADGFAVAAYTVNDAGRGQELRGWGVDALISDMPDLLLASIAAGAPPHRRRP